MEIRIDALDGPEIINLLEEHLRHMIEVTPPGSMHALDLDALRQPEIVFWSAWENGELLGCAALKELDPRHGEIKSMRTAPGHLGKGVASGLLRHMLAEARRRDYQRLSLETGSQPAFDPAKKLYGKFGFTRCAPFADYREDPNSVYMTLEL